VAWRGKDGPSFRASELPSSHILIPSSRKLVQTSFSILGHHLRRENLLPSLLVWNAFAVNDEVHVTVVKEDEQETVP
jgi:hypothetical protein